MADTKIDIILGMLFFTFSNTNIRFAEEELIWRTYTAIVILPITKRVQIINWKKFAKVALDPKKEAFVIYITTVSAKSMIIHLAHKAQIALLKADEALVTIPTKYSDFTNVFSKKSVVELLEHTKINNHAIDLEEDKQPPYGPIYSLGPVKLKILKTYIKTNLANGFICFSKSSTGTSILIDQKSDGSLCLCINY